MLLLIEHELSINLNESMLDEYCVISNVMKTESLAMIKIYTFNLNIFYYIYSVPMNSVFFVCYQICCFLFRE